MLYNIEVRAEEMTNRIVRCQVRDHVVHVDQPKAFGADDTAPTPPEMLAISLASCVVSTIQFLAQQRGIAVSDIHVSVAGTVDFSKAMGLSDEKRAGFDALKVSVAFETPLSAAEKAALLDDVFRKGASIDSIENPTPMRYELVE